MPVQIKFICNEPGKSHQLYHCKQPKKDDVFDNYEKEKREEVLNYLKCPKGNEKFWRNIFIFLCVPLLVACYINTFYINPKHTKRPKFKEYEHLRIRRKPFPWDEVRTLFHNPRVNALPTGYEIEVPEDEEYEP